MIKDIIKYGEAEVTYKNKQLLAEKPKLYNLFWETTLRCNAKCKHCGSRAGSDCNFKDELTTEEIENARGRLPEDTEFRTMPGVGAVCTINGVTCTVAEAVERYAVA